MRDHDGVDSRQVDGGDSRRSLASGAGEGHRRHALREHRIGQQADAADLHQHAGVADPGGRRLHRAARGGVAAQEVEVGREPRRRRPRLGRQAVAQRVELPFQERAEAARGEVDVVVLEAAVVPRWCRGDDRRRRRHGVFAAHQRRHQGEEEGEISSGVTARAMKHRPSLPTPVRIGDGWVNTYTLGLCRKSPCRVPPPPR